jgi:hypothetical protein
MSIPNHLTQACTAKAKRLKGLGFDCGIEVCYDHDSTAPEEAATLLQALIEREEMGDEVIEMTVSKLLSYELEKLRKRQGQIQEKPTAFEAQYNLKTTEFSRKFKEGKMGDAMDLFEWSALADMHQELRERLAEAESISHAPSDSHTSR